MLKALLVERELPVTEIGRTGKMVRAEPC